MIREKLKKYFSDRSFKEVNLHTPDMDLFYVSSGDAASLVWIVSEAAMGPMDKTAYDRYYEKIRSSFLQRNFVYVNILTVFTTGECKKAAELAKGTAFWIADEKYGRLVIYEDQPEDFCGCKRHIEQLLSFFTEDLKREEEIRRREEEERLRRQHYEEQARAAREAGNGFSGMRRKRRTAETPYAVIALIAVNVLVLFLVNLFGGVLGIGSWLSDGAVSWMDVIDGGEYYRLFTCMFLHAGIDHIMGNMIVLYAAGEILERNVGHIKFLIIYILGGLAGAVTSCCFYYSQHEYVESIGASGAVFAVVGGLVMCLVVNKESLAEVSYVRILLFAFYALYSGFISQGTDNAAHVGGLIGGGIVYLVIFIGTKLARKVYKPRK